VENCLKLAQDPVNILFFGLLSSWGLTSKYRALKQLSNLVRCSILDIYKKKFNERIINGLDDKADYMNIIDIMVNHNINCKPDAKINDTDIFGNVMLFQFAGLDTSLQASASGMTWMIHKAPEWIKKIREEGINNNSKIMNNQPLDYYMRETLRLMGTAAFLIGRVLTRDIDIGGIAFRKGDIITIPILTSRYKDMYNDAYCFKPERFEKEMKELPNNAFIPFYAGKRKCLGWAFGELNMKMIMGNLLNSFEFKGEEDYSIKMMHTMEYASF